MELADSSKPYLDDIMNELDLIVHTDSKAYISPSKLRKIYRKFCQWKQLFYKSDGSLNYVNRGIMLERTVVHYLLERCYWIRYGDSDTVGDLLKALFLVDGHLGKILDFQQLSLIPRSHRVEDGTYLVKTSWNDAVISKQKILPVHYFLEHANKKRLVFNGSRLADLNFLNCMHRHRQPGDLLRLPPCSTTFKIPETLIALLDYGLFASSESNEEDVGTLLTGILGVILISYEASSESNPKYTLRMIEAGNVFLRAIPRVRIDSLLKEQNVRHKEVIVNNLLHRMDALQCLPYLKVRCGGVQELQHFCRRKIRNVLYKNWMLPQGISLLPLPEPLKKYIKLRRD